MSRPPSRFSAATTPVVRDGRLVAALPVDWAQGRTLFGGVVAGLALRAAQDAAPPDRRARSVLVSFLRPVLLPGEVAVAARVERAGRAVTQVHAEVLQGGEVAAVAQVALGAPRPSRVAVPGPPPPEGLPPESLVALPYLPGVTPVFTQHYQYRWASGAFPFSSGDTARFDGWARPAVPEPVDAPALLGLLDAWPAPILALLDRPTPASTVSWMVNLDADPPPGGWPGDAWWRFAADTVAAGDGYATVDARLWTADGRLVATSRQLVAEFSGGAVTGDGA